MRLPAGELVSRLTPLLQQAGLWRDSLAGSEQGWLERVAELLKPRARKIGQFVEDGRMFLVEDVEYDRDGGEEVSAAPRHGGAPGGAHRAVSRRPCRSSRRRSEAGLRGLAAARGVKAAALIDATRVAVTGKAASPGLFEVLELLGRDRTRRRLATAGPLAAE